MSKQDPQAGSRDAAGIRTPSPGMPWTRLATLTAAFVLLALLVQLPAARGPFFSDDLLYIVENPTVRELSGRSLLDILDPTSPVHLDLANYAPLHLLGHALQYQLFGLDPLGYHLSNAVLHGLAAGLLVPLLMGSGIPFLPAALGGLFFLVHTANLEVLAWISQLKSPLAMVFMLTALLLAGRRPLLSTAAFALALVAKGLAVVALPVAALFHWLRLRRIRAGSGEEASGSGFLLAWTGVTALFLVSQFAAFLYAHATVDPLSESLTTRIWSSASVGAHYLVMAATTLGVSIWHEPTPVSSPFDPWVIGALLATLLLVGRLLWVLHRGRDEAAWWFLAGCSYVPVAQIFPFLYPMADRYLYFILPGLIGGTILAGQDALARLPPPQRLRAGQALAGAALLLCIVFGYRSFERAHIWRSEARLMADTVSHYPDSSTAHYFRALGAIRTGRHADAVEHLERAIDGRIRSLDDLLSASAFAPLRQRSDFDDLVRRRLDQRLERLARVPSRTDSDWIVLGGAYLQLGQVDQAASMYENVARNPESPHREEVAELLRLLGRRRSGARAPPGAAPP